MEFFKFNKSIPFMKHALWFNVISFLTFLLAMFFLWKNGLHLSIEFTGGAVMEVKYAQPVAPDKIRATLTDAGVAGAEVIKFGSAQDILVRLPLPAATNQNQNSAMETLKGRVMLALTAADKSAELKRMEFVGSSVGKELAYDGSLALLAVCVGIMLYLAIRFEWRFAVATIVANLHDIVIILGFFAFFQWEFSLPVLAAVLAILGYSVNESVVVFDRARENFRKMRKATTPEIFDAAITGTISRTIITHGTTQMMVIAMLILGGPTLHYFALALTIGICFGIYSSVLVACPLANYLGVSREDFVKPQKKEDEPEVISAQP